MHDNGPVVCNVVPVPNVHERPKSNFLISPMTFVEIEADAAEVGWVVCGIGHSHLVSKAEPSQMDIEMMSGEHVPPGWVFPIHSVRWRETRLWKVHRGALAEIKPGSAS